MGDNHSWWEHLEMAMPQLMNMGLSGVPFVGTDIGGFSGNASGELFARWMQLRYRLLPYFYTLFWEAAQRGIPVLRPLFYVRAGAIIPSGPELAYADERPLDPLGLDLYPGNGAFTLYEDDGHTFAYEGGQFSTTSYSLRQTADRRALEIGGRAGAYVPPARRLLIRVHAVSEQAAEGHPGANYDPTRRLLTLQTDDEGRAQTLHFKLSS